MTASYYRQTIDPGVLEMYVEDLEDLPGEQVIEAYKAYRKNPKNTQFPLPAQIRGMIAPVPTSEAIARECLGRINTAISKFGYVALLPAKEYIGDIGWKYVESCGGWARLCESDFIHNGAAQAQARSRLIDLAQFGTNSLATALTQRNQIEHREEPNLIDMEKRRQLNALVERMEKDPSIHPKPTA